MSTYKSNFSQKLVAGRRRLAAPFPPNRYVCYLDGPVVLSRSICRCRRRPCRGRDRVSCIFRERHPLSGRWRLVGRRFSACCRLTTGYFSLCCWGERPAPARKRRTRCYRDFAMSKRGKIRACLSVRVMNNVSFD